MLRDVLVELGYIVTVAGGGAEALQLVPVFAPDVVLLDLLMPEMSGVEVLEHLRRDRPTLPVVIMSGCPRRPTRTTPAASSAAHPPLFSQTRINLAVPEGAVAGTAEPEAAGGLDSDHLESLPHADRQRPYIPKTPPRRATAGRLW